MTDKELWAVNLARARRHLDTLRGHTPTVITLRAHFHVTPGNESHCPAKLGSDWPKRSIVGCWAAGEH